MQTVTTDMARDTREVIAQLCRTHMENPNAIILCVQVRVQLSSNCRAMRQ